MHIAKFLSKNSKLAFRWSIAAAHLYQIDDDLLTQNDWVLISRTHNDKDDDGDYVEDFEEYVSGPPCRSPREFH